MIHTAGTSYTANSLDRFLTEGLGEEEEEKEEEGTLVDGLHFATPKSTLSIETVDLEETGNSQKQGLAIAVPNEKSWWKEREATSATSETIQTDKRVSLRAADAKARGDKGFRLHAFFAKHALSSPPISQTTLSVPTKPPKRHRR
ncbi:hypothetical protein VNO77_17240 [Canavalia gladiata]|uniref:Uncharacterized protein n=1 Tax=Canavalia gladiata TaxID=3824 RepID=A0AAN9QIJ2_CANGL